MASLVPAIQRAVRAITPSSWTAKAAEGQYRPGPYFVQNPTGVLPHEWGQFWNFWQMGYDPIAGGSSALVEACVNAYAQTIALCPGDHWRTRPDGGRDRITTSALSRMLRKPNDYQSRSDFVLNLVRHLYLEGNSYALAERNDRFEVSALHLFDPRTSRHRYSSDGAIFYQLDGNRAVEKSIPREVRNAVPQRDVLHVKLDTQNYDPLQGLAPLRHCSASVAIQNALSAQLITFFGNRSIPSGVIETELTLSTEQVRELRARWEEQAKGLGSGGVPILTNGLKYHGISTSPKETGATDLLKMTAEEVCLVFGVPPAILGITDRATFNSVETLMQFWLARGLGFAVNHVECAFDSFFGLSGWPQEYVEFDVSALLRPAFKDRIDAMVKGVQGAVFSPNEARRMEGYPDAKDGDEPRVQQQVVPLSAWSMAPPQTPRPDAPKPAAPVDGEDGEEDAPEKPEDRMALLLTMLDGAGGRPKTNGARHPSYSE